MKADDIKASYLQAVPLLQDSYSNVIIACSSLKHVRQ